MLSSGRTKALDDDDELLSLILLCLAASLDTIIS